MKRPITNLVMGCLVFLALQLNAQTTTFTISPTTVTAATGSQFTVDITVDDFDEIVSFQYSNNWNEAILEFVEITNITGDLPGLSTANFGTTSTANGELSLSWFDATVMGVTLDPGTVLYSLTFEVLDDTGTDIIFSGAPTTIEIINVSSQEVTMDPVNCAVNGGGGGTPPPPPPAGDLTIIGSDETGASGSNVCLAVTANDFTDIVSMQFSMHFDESIIEYTGVQSFGLTDLSAASFGTTGTGSGDLTVSWFDSSTNGISLPNGSTLFEVCFDLVGSSGDVSAFTFNGTPTNIEVINTASQEVTPAFDAGSVTVNGGTPPPPSGDLTIIGSDETAMAGSNVCVDVTANNFDDIVSMQFSMHWDESILDYTGVQGFGLPDLSAASFGATGTSNGDLSVSWFDNTTLGQSVSNGSTLFQVCFDVIGSNGDVSSFTFDGTPTTVEIIDASSMEITPSFDAGSVTVNGGTPPPPPPVNGFAIIASDETMDAGESFCVAVSVNDFEDIVSMQYTMEWDENLFDYTGVQSFGLPDLSPASFGTTMVDNGVLTMSWFDNTTLGITLDDGDVIYEVCFEAIGPVDCDNTTQFEFSDAAATIEVIEASGTEVPFQGVDGNLTICDGDPPPPPPTGDFTFTAGSMMVEEGAAICVPVTVDNSDCITSVQFSMSYDTDVLEYTGVQNFGFPDITPGGNFNVNTTNGTVAFIWFDQNGIGIEPTNGTVVFELCFNVLGNNGDIGDISFENSPTPVEVIDCASNEVTPVFASGEVEVGVEPCDGPVNITNVIVNDVNCVGGNTGSIDISVNGGNGVYTYLWQNSAGNQVGTNQDVAGIVAGEYCVTVTSCLGVETATACYTIEEPTGGPVTVTGTVMNPACFGDPTGSIDISVSGGTTFGTGCAGYTYMWNDGNTNADRFGISAGPWSVTVTDCNGCQDIESFNVANSPSELTASATATSVSCFGECDATVTAAANGGVGPYDYRITCGGVVSAWQTSNIFEDQCAGACFVSVRDDFGCVVTTPVTIGTPNPLSGNANVTNDTDNCNGSIDLSANGGTGSLSYSWAGPASFSSSNQDIFNLCPGEYCVTVTDNNDCEWTQCFDVIAPLSADATPASIEPACFATCDGEVTLNFTGGIPPFTYDWSGPSTPVGEQPFTQMCGGSYTVTVNSSDGQSITIDAVVGEASQPVAITVQDVDNVSVPTECDGEILISAAGGFGGYTYEWSPNTGVGLNTNNPTSLCLDDYTVTVTDIEGCTAVETPIEVGYDPTVLNMGLSADPICNGASGGELNINVSGGLAPYDFTFDVSAGGTPINDISNHPSGTLTVDNLLPGTYTVTVTDAAPGTFQQTDIATITIEEVEIILSVTTIFPVDNEPDYDNGAIDIEVDGGQGPYTYFWSTGFTGKNPFNLIPGDYDLTITDANGCTGEFDNIPVNIFNADVNASQPDCPDGTGSLTAIPTGSLNEPFTYLWEDASGNDVGDEVTLANVSVGTYTLTVTDTLGRSVTTVFELNSVSNLSASLEVTTDINGFAIRCFGEASGTASVAAVNGVAPYDYLWSNGSVEQTASGLSAGTVTVTVTDGEDCNFELSANLNQPDALDVQTANDRESCGENTGTATAIVDGGVFPYEYNWDDELLQTSQTAILLAGGVYAVTVVDANGCDETANADVDEFIPLDLQAASEPDNGTRTGKAIAIVNGGTPPYEFQWNDFVTPDSILTELLPGTYIVKVSDAAGCEDFLTIVVDDESICLDALTVITPEGDGFNEEFKIGCLNRYADNELQIFNRWGQLVFRTTNYSDSDLWRGTNQRGNEVPDGVYFYVFEYLDPVVNSRETIKGSVSVLRK